MLESFLRLGGGKCPPRPAPTRQRFVTLWGPELLERRDCPAANWVWAQSVLGGNPDWSNPGGNVWEKNGAMAAPGDFPGKVAGDNVYFNDRTTGPATSMSRYRTPSTV